MLGLHREQHHEDRHERDPEHAERRSGARAEQPREPRGHQHHAQGPDDQRLGGEESQQRRRVVLVRGSIVQELERRPVMANLPCEVGGYDQYRDQEGEPGTARSEPCALRRQYQRCPERRDEERRRVLGHQPQAHERAEHHKVRANPAGERARDHQHASAPQELIEGVHVERVGAAQVHRPDQHRERGEALGEATAAEPLRDHSAHEHQRGMRERGQDAQREQRSPQHACREGGDQRDHRRMVDVAPRQPPPAGDVVELVAKITVAMSERGMQRERGEREDGERAGREGKLPGLRIIPAR